MIAFSVLIRLVIYIIDLTLNSKFTSILITTISVLINFVLLGFSFYMNPLIKINQKLLTFKDLLNLFLKIFGLQLVENKNKANYKGRSLLKNIKKCFLNKNKNYYAYKSFHTNSLNNNKNEIDNSLLKNTELLIEGKTSYFSCFKNKNILEQLNKGNIFLSNILIQICLTVFWEVVMNNLKDTQVVLFQMIAKYENEQYCAFFSQKVTKNDFNKLYETLMDIIAFKSDMYLSTFLMDLIFKYIIIPEDKIINKKSVFNKGQTPYKMKHTKLMGYKFPNTADITKFGKIIFRKGSLVIVEKLNTNYRYRIEQFENLNRISVLNANGSEILNFVDTILDPNNLGSFIRTIKDHTYIYKDSKLIVKKIVRKTNFLKSKALAKKISSKFITLDIETRVVNNIIVPICISFYDGLNSNSFYLLDFNNEEEMIQTCLLTLINKKYDGYVIYVHNLSYFDGTFYLIFYLH